MNTKVIAQPAASPRQWRESYEEELVIVSLETSEHDTII